jgi:hypothetical protein
MDDSMVLAVNPVTLSFKSPGTCPAAIASLALC